MRGKYLPVFAYEKNFAEILRKFLPGAWQAICAAKHFGFRQFYFCAGGILFNLPFAAGGEDSPVGFSAGSANSESAFRLPKNAHAEERVLAGERIQKRL